MYIFRKCFIKLLLKSIYVNIFYLKVVKFKHTYTNILKNIFISQIKLKFIPIYLKKKSEI